MEENLTNLIIPVVTFTLLPSICNSNLQGLNYLALQINQTYFYRARIDIQPFVFPKGTKRARKKRKPSLRRRKYRLALSAPFSKYHMTTSITLLLLRNTYFYALREFRGRLVSVFDERVTLMKESQVR